MQAVDVLCHHRGQTARALKLGKLDVRLVGLGVRRDHALAVEGEKLRRMRAEEAVGEHGLWRIGKMLVVEAIDTAEIWDAACRGYAGATKEDRAAVLVKDGCQRSLGLDGVRDGSSCTHRCPLS